MKVNEKITFETLHQLVSEVDAYNNETYPISFTVDGVKYRAGIGDYNLETLTDEDNTEDLKEYEDYKDFFNFDRTELQYLSRVDDEEEFNGAAGCECVLDVDDPDTMIFENIGEMIKKCCNITESSDIRLYPNHSFNGHQFGIFWFELSDEIVEKERKNIRQYKSEIK
jgi:hypothetical protein